MKSTGIIVLLAALGLGAPAFAQVQPQPQPMAGEQAQQRKLTGILESVRWTRVTGAAEPHVLARVREGAQVRVVDLGPASQLEQATLVLGEPITVMGYAEQGRGVDLVAERLALGGGRFLYITQERLMQPRSEVSIDTDRQSRTRTARPLDDRTIEPDFRAPSEVEVDETEPSVEVDVEAEEMEPDIEAEATPPSAEVDIEAADPSAGPLPEIEGQQTADSTRVQGYITELSWRQLEGMTEPHLMATVRTQGGGVAFVDLGTMAEAGGLQLEEGELISVVGAFHRMGTSSVLVARAVAEIEILDRNLP